MPLTLVWMSFIFKVVDIPWYGKKLPSTEADKYEPFFNPRKSVNLSNLGEIPLASSTSQYYEQRDCLLAVSFSSPMVDKDLFSHHHEGTVVGFYNLVKRARDQTYHLWVAKATENSTYSYKVIKVLHFSSMTNAFQGFNGE
ncbi:BRCA2, helical, partial [Musa troglodytarum]